MNTDLCYEEKSYHEWVANNLSFVNQNKQSISIMKKLYMEGFAAGFDYANNKLLALYQRKLKAEEELQK